jgi:SAM-dependent methyltransferase
MALLAPYAEFLLEAARDRGPFARTLTVGRQQNMVGRGVLARFGVDPAVARAVAAAPYADRFLLDACGASSVEAVDASDYEGADLVADLNRPVPTDWHGRYDVVIDGGTLEHIFFATTALASLMQMVRPGGRLFLATPTNNHCGHGFYQFSPEFLYRALAPEHGYRVNRMVLFPHAYPSAELTPRGPSYAVADPAVARGRITLQAADAALLFVEATRLSGVQPFVEIPQQSDYTVAWKQGADSTGDTPNAAAGRDWRALLRPAARWLSSLPVVRGNIERRWRSSLRNRSSFRRIK